MTEAEAATDEVDYNFLGSLGVAVLVGVGLVVTARAGALQLLVAVAAVQALLAFAWVFGMSIPGRVGALVIAAAAAAAADVAVSVWPHSKLGTLLAVLGLAVPVMFVHQLWRGTARAHIVASLGAIAILVLAEVALPGLLQLGHEFHGITVVAGVVAAATGALVVGLLVDMILAAPRFDTDIPRGLLAVLASAGMGGSVGYLMLRESSEFVGGRGAFAGAAVGALVAFFAVAVAFFEHEAPSPTTGFGRRVRPVLGVAFPISVMAPVAFVLCLAIRA